MWRADARSMVEILSQDFIRTARAKGLSEGAVLVRHGLRGVCCRDGIPGAAFASIITGSFVVESIFSIPGLGRLFVSGALGRDYTMVQGTVLLYAALVVLMNLAADIAQAC
jgi:oligopeptide transport system permease protein